MFRGTFTALVTPFRNGEIDVSAFENLIEKQIAAGITGIVAIGTTGESPTLSHEEREQLIDLAVATARETRPAGVRWKLWAGAWRRSGSANLRTVRPWRRGLRACSAAKMGRAQTRPAL